jgi:hypothetical protein
VCFCVCVSRRRQLQEGEVLYQSGDFGDCAYVVAHGKLSLSVRRSSDGSPVLMQSVGRGACIGESALVVPATRTVTVVALEPTLLLRLTNASLTAALGTHTKLWRDLRTAVLWREPFQLIRLPVLRSLVGTDSEAYLLAPLCDMFRMTCVASIASVPVLQPNPLDCVDEKDALRLPWCFTTSHLAGPSLNSLLLVASGSVVVKLDAQNTLPLKAGEWLNGSTLMKTTPSLPHAKVGCCWCFCTCVRLCVVPPIPLGFPVGIVITAHQRVCVHVARGVAGQVCGRDSKRPSKAENLEDECHTNPSRPLIVALLNTKTLSFGCACPITVLVWFADFSSVSFCGTK